MRRKKGFTLVEIMIVVAIIALLAAIAIPNLLRARVSAAQAAAKSVLHTLSTAYETYSADNNGTYNVSINNLFATQNPRYINNDFSDGTYYGFYTFTCAVGAGFYTCTAYGASGADIYDIETGGVVSWGP
ncbi:MAG: prepilin-type N-terminal cleavage/methylation domain-containing protein [Candidatus Omnitrophota bacterium]